MITEIKGKISKYGINLSDTLEDKLTGDVFGSLRYMPFDNGIKQILLAGKNVNLIKDTTLDYWADTIEFWPYDEDGEIDVLITLEDLIIGIEVKYLSGLSSDDQIINIDDKIENSKNQLARESRILAKLCKRDKCKGILIFLAPENISQRICNNVIERKILDKDIILGYISWESVLETITYSLKKDKLNQYERLILEDIRDLLKRKGFDRFKDFSVKETVNKDYFFEFHNDNKDMINFKFDDMVDEGGYYEFR